MKAFLLLLAAFLSTTVTLTNAAALPRDAVSRLPLSVRNLRGPTIGDGGLQDVALEARAGEEEDVPQPGPSNSGRKRRHSNSPSPPKPAPDPIPGLIENVHKMLLRIVNREETEGKLSQGQANQYATTVKNDTMNVMAAQGSKTTGNSKGSEGGRSGSESTTSSHSSFGSSCSSSGGEASESDLDAFISEVMDGLVKKGGIPDYLLDRLRFKLCLKRDLFIREQMEPAEKRRKTDK